MLRFLFSDNLAYFSSLFAETFKSCPTFGMLFSLQLLWHLVILEVLVIINLGFIFYKPFSFASISCNIIKQTKSFTRQNIKIPKFRIRILEKGRLHCTNIEISSKNLSRTLIDCNLYFETITRCWARNHPYHLNVQCFLKRSNTSFIFSMFLNKLQ